MLRPENPSGAPLRVIFTFRQAIPCDASADHHSGFTKHNFKTLSHINPLSML